MTLNFSQFGLNNQLLNYINQYSPQDQQVLFNAFQTNPNLLNQVGNSTSGLDTVFRNVTGTAPVVNAIPAATALPNASNNNNNNNTPTSLWDLGTNQDGQTTFGGATGFQWANAALGAASSLYGIYNSNRQYKLAKANFEEQKALQRANYENQAKSYNNNLRNQQSGRSFSGMSGAAARNLGSEYNSRKARESYA